VKDGVVEDVGFEGRGCAISIASASMMTEILRGKQVAQVGTMFERFHQMVTAEGAETEATGGDDLESDDFEKLTVLSGVREFPMRVKCATLAWHTMQAALKGGDQGVSTE